MADPKGNKAVVMVSFFYQESYRARHVLTQHSSSSFESGESHRKVETMLRTLCIDLGTSAAISPAPLSGKAIKEYAVLNTLSQSWYIGRAIHMARRAKADVVDAIVSL